MKRNKIIYWSTTGLVCAIMLFSIVNYVFNHEMIAQAYTSLGYPIYLIYPLAVAKLLGVIAILTKKSRMLKEWAYAGFFYEMLLAFFAHIMAGDGMFGLALIGLICLVVSYIFDKKVFQ